MEQNKKVKELVSNYKTTFNTDTGKQVLDDLKKKIPFFQYNARKRRQSRKRLL